VKAHADAGTGMVHTVEFTAANVNDVTKASVLVRPNDEVVYADSGYTGIGKREELVGDRATAFAFGTGRNPVLQPLL